MRRLVVSCFVALALMVSALPAAEKAFVYAVHGIPGENGFPVDIAVDGNCLVKGFTFGNVGGPLSLDPGSRNVEVFVSDSMNPCSGTPALKALPFLNGGTTYAVAAHLTEDGKSTLSAFVVDLSRNEPGTGRFILHHTAAAPCVDVEVSRNQGRGKAPGAVTVPNFCNGAQVPAAFRPGDWQAALSVGGNRVFGPATLTLKPNTAQLVFAVGVFPETFTFIVKEIPTRR